MKKFVQQTFSFIRVKIVLSVLKQKSEIVKIDTSNPLFYCYRDKLDKLVHPLHLYFYCKRLQSVISCKCTAKDYKLIDNDVLILRYRSINGVYYISLNQISFINYKTFTHGHDFVKNYALRNPYFIDVNEKISITIFGNSQILESADDKSVHQKCIHQKCLDYKSRDIDSFEMNVYSYQKKSSTKMKIKFDTLYFLNVIIDDIVEEQILQNNEMSTLLYDINRSLFKGRIYKCFACYISAEIKSCDFLLFPLRKIVADYVDICQYNASNSQKCNFNFHTMYNGPMNYFIFKKEQKI